MKKCKTEAMPHPWKKNMFREKVIDWAEAKTEKDRETATNLVSQILEESGKGVVEPITKGFPQGNA